jgi:hypothetical protein
VFGAYEDVILVLEQGFRLVKVLSFSLDFAVLRFCLMGCICFLDILVFELLICVLWLFCVVGVIWFLLKLVPCGVVV